MLTEIKEFHCVHLSKVLQSTEQQKTKEFITQILDQKQDCAIERQRARAASFMKLIDSAPKFRPTTLFTSLTLILNSSQRRIRTLNVV